MKDGARRGFLKLGAAALAAGALQLERQPALAATGSLEPEEEGVPDVFPTQTPELVREMVTVAHYDLNRVKELVQKRPSLARAAWDWGFGDWECALGAASHMGNRPIAEFLLSKGARPSLFSAAMLGQLEVVRAFVAAQPGVEKIRGPHSIPLLAHAKAGGEGARPVLAFLQSLGDAGADPLVPLPDDKAASIAGTYVFGVGMSQNVEVRLESGSLTWTRRGMMGRPMVHLGELAFYPVGAEAVRIRFRDDPQGTMMTVEDPDVVLTARKKRGS